MNKEELEKRIDWLEHFSMFGDLTHEEWVELAECKRELEELDEENTT